MMARHLRRLALTALLPVAVLVAWWVTSAQSTSPYYPPLSQVLDTFRTTWVFARVPSDVVPGVSRMAAGYALGTLAGVAVGVVLGRFRPLGRALNPAVQFGRSLPGATLVPISVLVFGIGDFGKIVVIGFIAMFPVLLNTIDAVRSLDPQVEDVCRVFRLTPAQRLLSVLLPASGPQIVSGMRVSLQLAFIMMVVTEMFASTNGIGRVTVEAKSTFDMPAMWSGMLLLGILGIASNGLLLIFQRRVLRWHSGLMKGI
ncbi:ABC transporter permease [Dactylosporangium sp. CA-233914]|uniref:ABC transporter permease n=1 Tax=Dactylosporangium sp. CA-233914 TaxID=3239934 RepID=UPI003D8E9C5A